MKVVGVTACPTGVAHTYMSAEALVLAGEKYGIDVKIETQGTAGIENNLTEEDIKEAACNRCSNPGRRKIPWKESHENGCTGSDEKSRAYHEEDQRYI